MTAAIELRDLTAGYDSRPAVEDVDLSVGTGELVALVGGNGAGKSTLLKVMAGLLPAWHGSARVLGVEPGRARLRTSYLPQTEQLRWDLPLLVEDVVLLGFAARLGIGRRPGAAERRHAASAMGEVGAEALARRWVGQLSGGERQRVLLARTLVSDPEVLLLDEPATGVDPTTEEQLMEVLERLARAGRTVLVATHDLTGVMAHFPRVVCVNRRIVADGGVDILRDDEVLRRTYGGHPGGPRLIKDEHHA